MAKVEKNIEEIKTPEGIREGLETSPDILKPVKPREQAVEMDEDTPEKVSLREVDSASEDIKNQEKEPDLRMQIEEKLSENMFELFEKLSENRKKEFKSGGEKTAQGIISISRNDKLTLDHKYQEIHLKISKWLSLLLEEMKSLSHFYIEGEAKRKTEEVAEILGIIEKIPR